MWGNLTEGLLRYEFGGLIFRGAYTWRGLFSKFYGTLSPKLSKLLEKKKVDLVVALRTMLGEWGGIQALCCAGVNPA